MLERGGVVLPVSQLADWVRRAEKSGPDALRISLSAPVYGWRRDRDGRVIVYRSTGAGEFPYAVEAESIGRPWMLGETYELGRRTRCDGMRFERRCFTPGGEYVYAELPAGSQADARRQRADFQVHFNRDPEEMSYRFQMVPAEEVLRTLEDLYGDRLRREMAKPDIRSLAESVRREGFKSPPVAAEGRRRALAAALLEIPLPYFGAVAPIDVVAERFIPTLDGR